VRIEVLEHADPEAPYGLKGVGEPPNISTPPAVLAALRAATGRDLTRAPVRPEHIVGPDGTGPEHRAGPGLALGAVNAMDEDAFVAALGDLFEHAPWVARAAYARRPFDSVAGLHGALEAAMRAAPRDDQVALVRAHPELAGREARAGELTAASTSEQARAGLHRLTAAEVAQLDALNRAYRERFGFPLLVCVREHTKDSILAWGQARLAHTREDELDIALGEIAKIAGLRLRDLVAEDPA
jgi:2-oxo-4-hydroxy-4-carboxy-5-ureidoimidazoline decarboxylase